MAGIFLLGMTVKLDKRPVKHVNTVQANATPYERKANATRSER